MIKRKFEEVYKSMHTISSTIGIVNITVNIFNVKFSVHFCEEQAELFCCSAHVLVCVKVLLSEDAFVEFGSLMDINIQY